MTSQRLESDFGTTQNQYHLSKTPIFHQNHSKFWLILGSFGLHFRLNGLLLPHFSLLPQHDKHFVQRLLERCVAVWQQIYKNKNFQQNTSEAKGTRFSKNKRRLFLNKYALFFNNRSLSLKPHALIACCHWAYRFCPLSDKQAALPLIARRLLGYRTLSGI